MYLSTVAFLGVFFRRRLHSTCSLLLKTNDPFLFYVKNSVSFSIPYSSQKYSCFSKPFDTLYLSMTTDAGCNQDIEFSHLLLQPDKEGVERASKLLNSGGIVAFPTETVYGLGLCFTTKRITLFIANPY